MNDLMKFIIPVICVIIGALLQFFLSKKSDERKQQNLLKVTAYTDFIKGLAGLAIFHKQRDTSKEMEYRMLVADAKSRICVYGDDTVIKKISHFLRNGGSIVTPDSYKIFVDIIVEIRKKHIGQVDLDINDFSQLLIGEDVEK